MVSFKMSPHHCQTTWKICKLMQMIGKPEALGGSFKVPSPLW